MTAFTTVPDLDDFDSRLESLACSLLSTTPNPLRESMLYSLLGPGKRIRPRLVAAVGKSLGLPTEIYERLGAAIEMVHAFTLIHDDLPAMDNDDVRRGRPTNHKVYGEATALLAGDALALLAVDAILPLRTELAPDRTFAVLRTLLEAAGARGVIAGQVAEASLRAGDGVEKLWEVFRLKTGALFRASLMLPALAAGSPSAASLGKLGDAIGIAFQIADDLEDDFVSARATLHHVAAFLDFASAQAAARNILHEAVVGLVDVELKAAITPFLVELEKKLSNQPGVKA